MNCGDIVRIINTPESKDYFGFYADSDAKIVDTTNNIIHVELFDGNIAVSPKSFLEPISDIYNKVDSVCECGAKHTEFPNHHLFYCDLYKG